MISIENSGFFFFLVLMFISIFLFWYLLIFQTRSKICKNERNNFFFLKEFCNSFFIVSNNILYYVFYYYNTMIINEIKTKKHYKLIIHNMIIKNIILTRFVPTVHFIINNYNFFSEWVWKKIKNINSYLHNEYRNIEVTIHT